MELPCRLLLLLFVVVAAAYSASPLAGLASNPFQHPILSPERIIDDCCCKVESVSSENKRFLKPWLDKIVDRTFFKFFKLNLYKECSHWAVSSFCSRGGGCNICECDKNEIPVAWKQEEEEAANRVQPQSMKNGFKGWNDVTADQWTEMESEAKESSLQYVNLRQFPETNTGFVFSGANVWKAIYSENCFQGNIDDMCLEQRLLLRLVSGLHSSISMHIAGFHSKDNVTGDWLSNQTVFEQRFRDYPERIENLYFVYVFTLRALSRLAPLLRSYEYKTGGSLEEDRKTQQLVREFLDNKLICTPSFDESLLFRDANKALLKQQFKSYFLNISSLMDCLNCNKCRVWGKLQMLGLGTALKVLMSEPGQQPELQRNEIVALINFVRQLSTSVDLVDRFSASKKDEVEAASKRAAEELLLLTSKRAPWKEVALRNAAAEEDSAEDGTAAGEEQSQLEHELSLRPPASVGILQLGTLVVATAIAFFTWSAARRCSEPPAAALRDPTMRPFGRAAALEPRVVSNACTNTPVDSPTSVSSTSGSSVDSPSSVATCAGSTPAVPPSAASAPLN
jgi:ERO1-like protein alpha